jgi:hypothetical protein
MATGKRARRVPELNGVYWMAELERGVAERRIR